MPEDDEDQIRDLILEEKQRGKKHPVDISAKRRRIKLLNAFRVTLANGDEETFKELLIYEIGQLPGTPEYKESLKKWRALRGTSG